MRRPSWRIAAPVTALGLLLAAAAPVVAQNVNGLNTYRVTNLVSDVPGLAQVTDPNLVNGWGITASGTSPWWVSDNGTDNSTLYNGAGTPLALVVAVPGGPTGTTFNFAGAGFAVQTGATMSPSRFLFATEGGQVLGWASPAFPTAVPGYTATDGAVYKGLTIAQNANGWFLFATDFHNGKVDVFDSSFAKQSWAGAFTDPAVPAGFAPFGIQNLNGTIFVTFAKQDADAHDEVDGGGLGIVDAFATDGSFMGRVATRGELNAPWGLAWAPSDFGKFSGDLLVGNFGNGRIHAFAWTPNGWEPRGPVKGTDHRPITIDGLWGIGFGNGANSGHTNVLYFAAGPDHEAHGLFGSIDWAP